MRVYRVGYSMNMISYRQVDFVVHRLHPVLQLERFEHLHLCAVDELIINKQVYGLR